MQATITYEGTLIVTSCWCGVQLAIPHSLYRKAQSDSNLSVYCPLGHTFVYRDNEAERERKAREKAEANAKWYRQRMTAERELREHTERKLAAQKGATTKARKRHAAALCPCCNRSFVQLRRHMAAKHPDYDPAKG